MGLIALYGEIPKELKGKPNLDIFLEIIRNNDTLIDRLKDTSLAKQFLECDDCLDRYSIGEAYVLRIIEGYFRKLGLNPILGTKCPECYTHRRSPSLNSQTSAKVHG